MSERVVTMEFGQIIVGCIVSIIAISLGIYVSFTARGKGPILSNTYIWLSKQERDKVDKKPQYKLVTIIFGCLALVFALMALHIFTLWKWPYVIMWFFIAFVIIYAIVDAVKSEKSKNGK